jgi:hypothetical protein
MEGSLNDRIDEYLELLEINSGIYFKSYSLENDTLNSSVQPNKRHPNCLFNDVRGKSELENIKMSPNSDSTLEKNKIANNLDVHCTVVSKLDDIETRKFTATTTIEKRLEILEYAEKYGLHSAANEYDVARSLIRYWRNTKSDLLLASNKRTRRSLSAGRKPQTDGIIEEQCVEWINSRIDDGILVSATDLYMYACQIKDNPLQNKSINARLKWAYKFMKRHKFTNRTPTHIGQVLPEHSEQLMIKFLRIVIFARNKYKYSLEDIYNCDETPINLDNPNKKGIAKIGAKVVSAKSLGHEKYRITALLTIAANGKKLSPFLIFKGQEYKDLYNKLQKYPLVEAKKVFCATQVNSWINVKLFMEYLNKLFRWNRVGRRKLLILDWCSAHEDPKVHNLLLKLGNIIG